MSSLCAGACDGPPLPFCEGMIFLKKIFDDTNTIADPNAQIRPRVLEADMSNEHANITPMVNGSNEMYVFAEYLTPKRSAYAATVKRGDKACPMMSM